MKDFFQILEIKKAEKLN